MHFWKWKLVSSKSWLLKVPSENRKKLRGRSYRGPKILKNRLWAPCNFPPLIFSDFLRVLLVNNFLSGQNFIYWSIFQKIVLGVWEILWFLNMSSVHIWQLCPSHSISVHENYVLGGFTFALISYPVDETFDMRIIQH